MLFLAKTSGGHYFHFYSVRFCQQLNSQLQPLADNEPFIKSQRKMNFNNFAHISFPSRTTHEFSQTNCHRYKYSHAKDVICSLFLATNVICFRNVFA